MKSITNPNHGNQSEIRDLKAGLLDYKAEGAIPATVLQNFIFSTGIKILQFPKYEYTFFKVSKSTHYRTDI